MAICPYCAFYKHPYNKASMAQFVADLVVEKAIITTNLGHYQWTLFFLVAVRNVVSKREFSTIMTAIRSHFNVLPSAEITMEMNPGIHSVSKLEFFKRMGITQWVLVPNRLMTQY